MQKNNVPVTLDQIEKLLDKKLEEKLEEKLSLQTVVFREEL